MYKRCFSLVIFFLIHVNFYHNGTLSVLGYKKTHPQKTTEPLPPKKKQPTHTRRKKFQMQDKAGLWELQICVFETWHKFRLTNNVA